jgi:hypothetical protein
VEENLINAFLESIPQFNRLSREWDSLRTALRIACTLRANIALLTNTRWENRSGADKNGHAVGGRKALRHVAMMEWNKTVM